MHHVYRNGVCNIAACDSTDSSYSLFSKRNPELGGAIMHVQNYTDISVQFTLIPNWVQLTWDTSRLYRRGWVVQERFLSARVLHFSKYPFWECRSLLATETYGTPQKSLLGRSGALPESQRDWIFSSEHDISSIERWWRVIEIYTGCDLTYGPDKLIAIGGLANNMSRIINEPYYAGIWGGEHLIPSLLWMCMFGSRQHTTLQCAEYRGL
jgi:hypothetical protein